MIRARMEELRHERAKALAEAWAVSVIHRGLSSRREYEAGLEGRQHSRA